MVPKYRPLAMIPKYRPLATIPKYHPLTALLAAGSKPMELARPVFAMAEIDPLARPE